MIKIETVTVEHNFTDSEMAMLKYICSQKNTDINKYIIVNTKLPIYYKSMAECICNHNERIKSLMYEVSVGGNPKANALCDDTQGKAIDYLNTVWNSNFMPLIKAIGNEFSTEDLIELTVYIKSHIDKNLYERKMIFNHFRKTRENFIKDNKKYNYKGYCMGCKHFSGDVENRDNGICFISKVVKGCNGEKIEYTDKTTYNRYACIDFEPLYTLPTAPSGAKRGRKPKNPLLAVKKEE